MTTDRLLSLLLLLTILLSDVAYASTEDVIYFDDYDIYRRLKKNTKVWDHWGKWSPCTVSCGVGKMMRWRHCISDGCAVGEKEAQIKPCHLKPCRERK